MSSLKILKSRIKSVKSTQKITKAMQLISAARLNKAKEALQNGRPYVEAVREMINDAVLSAEKSDVKLFDCGALRSEKRLVLVLTSDRGLCGAFNAAVIRKAKEYCLELQRNGEEFLVMCFGKRGYESLLLQFGCDIVTKLPYFKEISAGAASIIANILIADMNLGKFDKINIINNRFVSALKNEAVNDAVIPCVVSSERDTSYFEFEPLLPAIKDKLLVTYITAVVYGALLENAASEHSSRMTAMDSATRNAKQMLSTLSNKYNRTRQAVITKELIEIISGAQAL